MDPYMLSESEVKFEERDDKVLGDSSTATIFEIEYMGLKCAGKKLLNYITKKGTHKEIVSRFEDECRILSQVRHPNIVQFLGLYLQKGERAPILVMELLPTNLTSCIEQHGILPSEISYSILHDVALGLRYLHSQSPLIIHRNLNSNNILLTSNMTAKISDLGMARILKNMQASNPWTQDPVNLHFMPPEAQTADPEYDATTDVFSYGILMIHMLCGEPPEPQSAPNKIENDTLVAVPEAERRKKFLTIIGESHPLMVLIRKCIFYVKKSRPTAKDIESQLAHLSSPTSFPNQIQMLIRNFKDPKSVHLEKDKSRLSVPSDSQSYPNTGPKSTGESDEISTTFGQSGAKPVSSLDKKPTLQELMVLKYDDKGEKKKLCIINEAKHKWKDITNLIFAEPNKTTTLENRHGTEANECLKQAFIEGFIDKSPERYSQNWSGLIELLEDVGLETLVSKVKHAHALTHQ